MSGSRIDFVFDSWSEPEPTDGDCVSGVRIAADGDIVKAATVYGTMQVFVDGAEITPAGFGYGIGEPLTEESRKKYAYRFIADAFPAGTKVFDDVAEVARNLESQDALAHSEDANCPHCSDRVRGHKGPCYGAGLTLETAIAPVPCFATELADEFRAMALAAGVTADDLDGPPRCFAGCGAEVSREGKSCPACETKRLEADRAEQVRRAWGTVPQTLRWASLADPKLAAWCRDAAAVARVQQIAGELDVHRTVTLTGEAGAGKTTLACALLREWIRRGARKGASPADMAIARKARFAVATDLVHDRAVSRLGEHVPSIDLARQASVLVLDEVGRGKDAHGVIFGLLHERHREGRPTIITTPALTLGELAAATQDGGLARRVFSDATVVHVEVKP